MTASDMKFVGILHPLFGGGRGAFHTEAAEVTEEKASVRRLLNRDGSNPDRGCGASDAMSTGDEDWPPPVSSL